MGIFKFAAPISTLGNKKRHLHRPQNHLMESIIASIRRSIHSRDPFLFIDLIFKWNLPKAQNNQI